MSQPEKNLTFIEHLEELRRRLIISVAALVVGTLAATPFADDAIEILTRPLKVATSTQDAPRILLRLVPDETEGLRVVATVENVTTETQRLDQVQVDLVLPDGRRRPIGEGSPTGSNFYYRSLTDPIAYFFKAAMILGLILAIPVWVYQIWAFVAPGLKESEKRVVRPLFALSAVLFPCGVAFAYFLLSLVISFLLSIQIQNLAPLLDYSAYVRFAMRLMVGFGVVFELPVAILLLAHLGVVNVEMLRRYRRIAYVIIAFLAMLVTPPEPVSMLVILGPLCVLYELSVWLTRLVEHEQH